MTWGWNSNDVSVRLGGTRGTPEEARIPEAWPAYEAEYLKKRLTTEKNAVYDPGKMESSAKQVYLDKISENYKAEAEECLRREFNDWLQGKHKANQLGDFGGEKYVNQPGKPVRRQTYRIGDEVIAAVKDDWRHTWWGAAQLTHLPGVRDYLRRNAMEVAKADVYMNLLAEHGPQDLESAWMYFKHWVKGRPLSDSADMCDQELYGPGTRSDFGPHNPIEEIYEAQQHRGRELDILATRIGRAAGRRSETVRALSLGGEVSKSRLLPKEQQEQQELDELRALSAQPPNTPPPPSEPPPDLSNLLNEAARQLPTVPEEEADKIVKLTEQEEAKMQEVNERAKRYQKEVDEANKTEPARRPLTMSQPATPDTIRRVFGMFATPPRVGPSSQASASASSPLTNATFFRQGRIEELEARGVRLPQGVLAPMRTGSTMPSANVGQEVNLRPGKQVQQPQGLQGVPQPQGLQGVPSRSRLKQPQTQRHYHTRATAPMAS
jgi:hypothetical protein